MSIVVPATVKVPREFTRAYLSVKGWREAFFLRCWTCDIGGGIVFDEPPDQPYIEHPVRWLWEHARQGHEVGVNLCHSWTKQCGPVGDPYSHKEEWYRWWWANWDPANERFVLEIEDEDEC